MNNDLNTVFSNNGNSGQNSVNNQNMNSNPNFVSNVSNNVVNNTNSTFNAISNGGVQNSMGGTNMTQNSYINPVQNNAVISNQSNATIPVQNSTVAYNQSTAVPVYNNPVVNNGSSNSGVNVSGVMNAEKKETIVPSSNINNQTSNVNFSDNQNINKSIVASNVNVSSMFGNGDKVDSQSITMPNFVAKDEPAAVNNSAMNQTTINNLNNITVPEDSDASVTSANSTLYDTTSSINRTAAPVAVQKKSKVKIEPELLTAIIIAVCILVGILFVPGIFDLIDKLKNAA